MPPKKKSDATTITVKGKEYDINADFSWRELMTVEDLAQQPLGAPGAMHSSAVAAAFIFIVLKREDPALTWDAFLDSPVSDLEDGTSADESEGASPKRPTKARG